MIGKQNALRVLAAAAAATAMMASDNPASLREGLFTSSAEARIGRPMTPMSYAGVARRTTRRAAAVSAGAAAGAAAYGASVGACQQVVDVYGRVVTQCY